MPRPIDTIEFFYAHAAAIEREAATRYAEFAAWFSERDEEGLADLCRRLEGLERAHLGIVLGGCGEFQLPRVDERQYRWLGADGPEAPARELFYRVTSPRQLLEIALDAERNARRFFAWVARSSRNGRVRKIARQMANEEAEHVRWVQLALQYRDPMLDWERLIAEGCGPGVLAAN